MKWIIRQLTTKDTHVSVQFLKYGIGGVIAFAVDILVFFAVALTVLPSLLPDEYIVQFLNVDVPVIEETVRERNFVINSVIAFVFSNLTAYVINVLWVFHGGKHRRHMEITLFYVISIISVIAGTVMGWGMIRFLSLTTEAAFGGRILAAVMINFLGRKYIVFKG